MVRDEKDNAEIKKALEEMRKRAAEKQGPGKKKGRPKKDDK